MTNYFTEENKGESKTFTEGKYKLTITQYKTKEGSWSYSRGEVYSDDNLITSIDRNYSIFPFLWIIDHPNGHDYLIAGEDYQGQTVVELDTGKRKNTLSDGADKGWGFCWAEYTFNREYQILTVDGCIWACPYEFRFYDFSDPLNFKYLPINNNGYVDAEEKLPTFEENGIIRCYQLHKDEVTAYKDFKRIDDELVLQNEWVSGEEQKRRKERKEANERYEAEIKDFKQNDPLYLEYLNQLKDPIFNPEEYQSRGVTYDGWCPDFKVQEGRWCRRIVQKKKGYTVGLDWAMKTGPVKLTIFKDENKGENKFWMEHSPESIIKAFDYVRKLLK